MRFNFDKCIHGSVEGQVVTIGRRNQTERHKDQYPARSRTETAKHFCFHLPEMGRPRISFWPPRWSLCLYFPYLPLASVTHHGSKLLNAPTGYCFGDVEVAFRVGGGRVSECEMAAIMARAWYYAAYPQSSEDCCGCLVHEPSVVVAKIDIDNHVLT